MITERDLLEAIAECQGERNPDAQTCLKLASYYTILDHTRQEARVSFDAPPVEEYAGDSEFARITADKSVTGVYGVIDELMTTLQVLHPKLYTGVMIRLESL